MTMKSSAPRLVFANQQGQIFDHPTLEMAGMSGPVPVRPEQVELIPLPP